MDSLSSILVFVVTMADIFLTFDGNDFSEASMMLMKSVESTSINIVVTQLLSLQIQQVVHHSLTNGIQLPGLFLHQQEVQLLAGR